jgi:hypothetical protein
MSSEDFFNQSFSPARKKDTNTTGNRAPPPPPPPAASSSSSLAATAAAATASNIRSRNSAAMNPSSTSTSAGYYSNPSSSRNNKPINSVRPTGNYYPTSNNSSNNTNAPPAPSFHAYSNHTGNSNSNPYASYTTNGSSNGNLNHMNNSNNSNNNNDQQQDWFTGDSSSTTTAHKPYVTNYSNPNHNQNTNMNLSSSNPNFNVSTTSQSANHNLDVPSSSSTPSLNGQHQQHNNDFFNGTMDNNANHLSMSGPMMTSTTAASISSTNTTSFTNFNSSSSSSTSKNSINNMSSYNRYSYNSDDFADEPPLLEELGINVSHIQTKSLAVILPVRYAKTAINENLMEDADMAGPIVFGILLALELLLAGRIQFAYIYGLGLFGCLATTLIINLMSPNNAISIWTVVSILGYSLLPVNLLAAINILYRIRLMGDVGVALGCITIGWCTISSTRLFERGCGLRDQRYLIGYPNALLYSAFVLLTIF